MRDVHRGSIAATVEYPWDSPDLPPRSLYERCARHPISRSGDHGGCAFRDDDPAICPKCHQTWESIAQRPATGGRTCDHTGGS
jgi:hypothetical protein